MKYSLAGLICLGIGGLGIYRQADPGLTSNAILLALGLGLLVSGVSDSIKARHRLPAPLPMPVPTPLRPEPVKWDAELVHFLSLLQKRGRFVDFLMDDITAYPDDQVGAAARIVHQGCGTVLKEFFEIVPVRGDGEGKPVTVEAGFDPGRYRLVGKVSGQPPFRGTLLHKGWMTKKINLPRASGSAPSVIAPAEVELS